MGVLVWSLYEVLHSPTWSLSPLGMTTLQLSIRFDAHKSPRFPESLPNPQIQEYRKYINQPNRFDFANSSLLVRLFDMDIESQQPAGEREGTRAPQKGVATQDQPIPFRSCCLFHVYREEHMYGMDQDRAFLLLCSVEE